MARRYNTNAIQSAGAQGAAIGSTPTWYSAWDGQTGGNLLATFQINQNVPALALGEKLEIPAAGLSIVNAASGSRLVAGVEISNGGSGYTSPPNVSFSGGNGSGAQGVAIVANGEVVGVTITNPGYGYTAVPTVSFSGGNGSGAAGTVELSGIETERFLAAALGGATSSNWWIQAHSGDPGPNGTDNTIGGLGRFQQSSTNWTTAP